MGLRTLRVQYVLSYQCSHEALDDVEISRGKTRNSLLHIVSREHYMVNFAPCFLPKLLVIHGLATYVVERGRQPQERDVHRLRRGGNCGISIPAEDPRPY